MLAFKGATTHPVDEDNRVRIPEKFRNDLGQDFIMTRGLGGCISIMHDDEFEALAKRVYALGDSFAAHIDPNLARIYRYVFSGAIVTSTDRQNRVTLNPELKKQAGIGKEVVIIGRGKCIEIWDPARWEQYSEGDLAAEKVFEALETIKSRQAEGANGLPQAGSAEGDG